MMCKDSTAQSAQAVNSDSTAHSAPLAVQNGSHPPQQPSHGVPSTPATVAAAKPTNVATPKPSRAPRAPSSNVPAASSDSNNLPAPVTPAKAEASQPCTLQFPGFMNGMQARHDSLKAPPTIPFPSVPRQLLPKKDTGTVDQPNVAEGYPSAKPKREAQASVAPLVSQVQKPSVHTITGVPIQMQFHQPSVPVQFGGPNPQIQSQAMSVTSLPLPMPMPLPLQIGNPSVQQQVFVSGLQSHPMQPQGILHQSQNLSFSSQMGPQIPPQLGSMGLNMASQFLQQEAGKFGVPSKTVKITHPASYFLNVPPQSQPISSFPPAHPPNYYPGSYNTNSLFFQTPSSLPLSGTHPPLQPARYYNQVTVKPATSSLGEKDPTSSVSLPYAPKRESEKPSKPSQRDTDSSSQSSLQQSKPGPTAVPMAEAAKSIAPPGSESGQSLVPSLFSLGYVVPVEKPLGATPIGEGSGSELIGGRDSAEDQHEKSHKEKCLSNPNVARSTAPRAKKKRRELLKRLDSSGPTADLYLAYKGREDKKETVISAEITESTSSNNLEPISSDVSQTDASKGKAGLIKVEPDDWEDADISIPKLETSDNGKQADTHGEDSNGVMTKKYSTDFLLKFADQCTELPEGFEIVPDIAEAVIASSVGVSRDQYSSTGRTVDRSRSDRRGSGLGEEEKWNKMLGPLMPGRDMRMEMNYGPNMVMFRPGQVANHGVLRNLRTQPTLPEGFEKPLGAAPIGEGSESELTGGRNSAEDQQEKSHKEKSLSKPNVARSTVPRGKKKRKELLKRLDGGGPTADLHLAYKGPEEKKETVISEELTECTSSNNLEPISSDVSKTDASKEKAGLIKVEPDDWEDAADISIPKLETSDYGKQADTRGEDSNGVMTKKYSTDFLLKFADQCTELPEGFEKPLGAAPIGEGSGSELTGGRDSAEDQQEKSHKEKSLSKPNVARSTVPRGKKKRKELLKRLDGSGLTADLYLAYKGPEEKKETVISAEITESTSSNNLEPISSDVSQTDATKEKAGLIKVEPDDWEDAAGISIPKLETSDNVKQADTRGEDSNGVMTKKYSTDFLLKFADQCTELSAGFEKPLGAAPIGEGSGSELTGGRDSAEDQQEKMKMKMKMQIIQPSLVQMKLKLKLKIR